MSTRRKEELKKEAVEETENATEKKKEQTFQIIDFDSPTTSEDSPRPGVGRGKKLRNMAGTTPSKDEAEKLKKKEETTTDKTMQEFMKMMVENQQKQLQLQQEAQKAQMAALMGEFKGAMQMQQQHLQKIEGSYPG